MPQPVDDKITIIEGPPPVFEPVMDGWVNGINETSGFFDVSVTHLRTFNGPSLVERCHRAWRNQGSMFLLYRNHLGMEEQAPILAARAMDSIDGQVLYLWVRRHTDFAPREI